MQHVGHVLGRPGGLTLSAAEMVPERAVASIKAAVAHKLGKDSVKDVVSDGGVTKEELCTGSYADKCTAAGIS